MLACCGGPRLWLWWRQSAIGKQRAGARSDMSSAEQRPTAAVHCPLSLLTALCHCSLPSATAHCPLPPPSALCHHPLPSATALCPPSALSSANCQLCVLLAHQVCYRTSFSLVPTQQFSIFVSNVVNKNKTDLLAYIAMAKRKRWDSSRRRAAEHTNDTNVTQAANSPPEGPSTTKNTSSQTKLPNPTNKGLERVARLGGKRVNFSMPKGEIDWIMCLPCPVNDDSYIIVVQPDGNRRHPPDEACVTGSKSVAIIGVVGARDVQNAVHSIQDESGKSIISPDQAEFSNVTAYKNSRRGKCHNKSLHND